MTTSEDYVSFETAKFLKEKGFNWECLSYYTQYRSQVTLYDGVICDWSDNCMNHNVFSDRYSRPTNQMAVKWLREIHNIHITTELEDPMKIVQPKYNFTIWELNKLNSYVVDFYENYKVTCDRAIRFCLLKLI